MQPEEPQLVVQYNFKNIAGMIMLTPAREGGAA
jgi:hypothetical protein